MNCCRDIDKRAQILGKQDEQNLDKFNLQGGINNEAISYWWLWL
jgi:hypothetical protein